MNAKLIFLLLFLLICVVKTSENTDIISIGFTSNTFVETNARDAQAALTIFSKEFIKNNKKNLIFETHLYENINELTNDLKNDKLNMIALPIFDYFDMCFKFQLEPHLSGKINGSAFIDFLVIVKKNSGINSLSQLIGKNIATHNDLRGQLGNYWLSIKIDKIKKNYSDSTIVKFFSKESQSILSVFFGKTSAAIVTRNGYNNMINLNPQIGRETTILTTSPNFVPSVFATIKGLDKVKINEFVEMALNINDTKTGKQIAKLFKIDGLTRISSEMLIDTKKLYDEYQLLLKRNKQATKITNKRK